MMLSTVISSILVAAAPIRYEDFGAKGDGVTDDRDAIVAAHAAANAKGAPVRASDGATYYVGAGTNAAIVATDVDFGTAHFIIDDREVGVEDKDWPLFHIVSLQPSFDLKIPVPLRAGQTNLGVRLPVRSLVYIKCDNVRRYCRKGLNVDAGKPQQEPLIVEANGNIDPATPILWDYPEVTVAQARPIDEKRLTVRGGDFLTRANQAESEYNYYVRGFEIERSNVLVEKITHRISDESDHGAPYRAFISVDKCADVTVRDCVLQAHKAYSTIGRAGKPVTMGSYDLHALAAVNVAYVNCRQTTDISDPAYWGLFGSSFCKNLTFDGCTISRFDAHMGVYVATVRNCTIGYMALSSIGSGTFTVENTTVKASGFVRLRPDYGSTWNGKFVIRNCRYEPTRPGQKIDPVILGTNDGTHDFGYVCHLPDIEIDGLFIDDAVNPGKAVIFCDIGKGLSPTAKYPIVPPARVVLKNVKTASGRPFKTFAKPETFANTQVVNEMAVNAEPLTVTLTFDDGEKGHILYAAPALETNGWRGTFNITTDWIGLHERKMSWDEVRELKRRGHEIASHSCSHPKLHDWYAAGKTNELFREFADSRDVLARELGAPPRFFCHPFVHVSPEIDALVRAAGMEPYTADRFNVGCDVSPATLGRWLDQWIAADVRRKDILFHGITAETGGWKPFASAQDFFDCLAEIKKREQAGSLRVVSYEEFLRLGEGVDTKAVSGN